MRWYFPWIILRCPGVSKNEKKQLGLGAVDTFRSLEIIDMKVWGSRISKSKSYKFELKQNKITELLSTSFPEIYHKNKNRNKTKMRVFLVFTDFP